MVIANMAFFTALVTLPLGEVTAIFFVAPLFITALSVLLLNERVGPRRWAAVAVGLLGVVVMLRPGGDTFTSSWNDLRRGGSANGLRFPMPFGRILLITTGSPRERSKWCQMVSTCKICKSGEVVRTFGGT